jgi:acetyl esterase/lipase
MLLPLFPLFLLITVIVLIWLVARMLLLGPDLSAFDQPAGQRFGSDGPPSAAHQAVVASLGRGPALLDAAPRSQRVATLRAYLDTVFDDAQPAPATITSVDAGGVPAEWVLAPGADPRRRLLYIHGGAYICGSPRSHRRLTRAFSELAGAAVLAIDYRLMPEHPRRAGIDDCRAAYRWLLANGPQGPGAPEAVFVAGDSAGGNLTLSLIAWVRDAGLRTPDAAVALSPATDSTLGSPSLQSNLPTDPMLGPLFRKLARIPRLLLLWGGWLQTRIRPADPVISPVYGDLSRLPPVLVQVSSAEMLRDDARRWVNRAVAAGSPARLQEWGHMVHVWQIFHPELPEGRQALEEIRGFFAQVASGAGGARTSVA